ncbi:MULTISPECIES: glutamine amidotransferase [unclassified Ectothiorhodospira]|uniref:glutamine amidotransferase n=1 Tax=unclassified Ectothiorhodospira TaxID=2684909 RepID=UPI001EE7E441|nr:MULTISPECIES: glutamine amidotransferase [unclassified Ectothiorhodospira]MCG5515342.1 glutamine amidotransferase [Ectothiorhodospira sp. 9100]MCG5519220.1 glutamine amidotransferase [Ectothiorhodospira sp. 9905]
MGTLLIIKTGTKIPSLQDHPGDYEHWIAQGMHWPMEQVHVANVQAGDPLPDPSGLAAAIITGSGAMVTEQAAWMVRTAQWLTVGVDRGLPILGICFGHQLLAWALGGHVDYNPRGIEVGTTTVNLTDAAAEDALFQVLPERFPAQVSHSQSVLTLPAGAARLAWSDMDEHQGFRYGQRAWGLQFHPEFDERIVPHYVEYYRERLVEQGRSADELLGKVQAAPESVGVLGRFGELVRG